MTSQKLLNLITIGYAKQSLWDGTRERMRMKRYSSVMNELHVIVFTHKNEGCKEKQKDGNLFLYATNSQTKVGMLWKAFLIGRKIIATNKKSDFVVSSQDPFETSLVGSVVTFGNHAAHHIQMHGDLFNPLSYQVSIFQKLRAFFGWFMVRNAKYIRVVSERLKYSLVTLGVQESKISVLPVQSSLESFVDVGKNRRYQTNRELAFLYVGRFSSEKNILLLIRSFASISKGYEGVTLTLLGDGPQRDLIQGEIVKLNMRHCIFIQPWTHKVSEVMAAYDVLCLSSNHEGWAMVLVEAMATGMPVITTDVGCAREAVLNNKNGLIVSVGSEEEYKEALKFYLNKPKSVAKYGRKAHLLVCEKIITENDYLKKLVNSYNAFKV